MAKERVNDISVSSGTDSPEYLKAVQDFKSMCDHRIKDQVIEAKRIQKLAGLNPKRAVSFLDIPKFELALNCRIVVSAPHIQNRVIYTGEKDVRDESRKSLFLVFVRDEKAPNKPGHYHPIVKLQAFFRCSFFCPNCLKPASTTSSHCCDGYCSLCQHYPCTAVSNEISYCYDCCRTARSKACMIRHKKKGICDSLAKCSSCLKLYSRAEEHECGYRTCRVCGDTIATGLHHCSMRSKNPNDVGYRYMFADFEADPCDAEHVPNLIIAHWRCRDCIDIPYRQRPECSSCGAACILCRETVGLLAKGSEDREVCLIGEGCGRRRVQFFGDNVSDQFCEFLFSDQHTNFTVIFHNGQAYDFYMLMSYICRHGIAPKVIYRGSKIVAAHVTGRFNIRLIDSLNFLPMPLSAMPKVFGLQGIKKGTFPHWFNKKCNYSYEGPYPEPQYYGADNMKPEARESFLLWHSEQAGKKFNFMKELVDYCEDDVAILEESCMAFRKHVLDLTGREETVDVGGEVNKKLVGVDPLQYRTMASVCMAIFRYMFLPEHYTVSLEDGRKVTGELICGDWVEFVDEAGKRISPSTVTVQDSKFLSSPIARMPSGGFSGYDTFSKISIQWLLYEEKARGISIRHALSPEGEFRFPSPKIGCPPYRLDGYCEQTNTAFEFHGCVFHGCPECYPYDQNVWLNDSLPEPYPLHPHTDQTMRECHAFTTIREEYIKKKLGCDLIVMRECRFKQMIEEDSALKSFIENNPVKARLDPRKALFGGRTNASTLYSQADGLSSKIAYADITSLYPAVLKYDRFPTGSPTIIVRPQSNDISEYFGIVYCRIKPPRKLYHPVLPVHTDEGKLVFPLCQACMLISSQTLCKCSHSRRELEGTWCTVELQVALEMGYRIVCIYEVYHFPSSSVHLFSGYVNMFVKHKQEASGWPSQNMSESEKDRYIEEYFKAEGIRLDKDKIEYNLGARKINKQIANSLWGKFGEVQDRLKHVMLNDSASFYQYLTDPTIEVQDFHVLAPETCQVEYKHRKANLPECAYLNIFIAVFTTAHARIRLYRELHRLGRKALYYDTDSIIYRYKENDPEQIHPPYGDYLGMWTNELSLGVHISQFVSAGPKSYSYKTSSGEITVKVKGLTLTYAASATVNFETIKALVLHYLNPQEFPLPSELKGKDYVSVTYPSKICRDRYRFKLYGKDLVKTFKVTYGKRQLLRDGSYETVPFGF